jgi:hypothetical protein
MAVKNGCYKFLTVSLLKRLRDGRFNSETETATCFQKILGTTTIVIQGGDDGHGYRYVYKIPRSQLEWRPVASKLFQISPSTRSGVVWPLPTAL